MKRRYLITAILFVFCYFTVNAGITLPRIFSNNMILQRESPVPVWGKASPKEKIKVTFNGQVKKTVANDSGLWKVELDPMPALKVPSKLIIEGKQTIILENILVGEVWLCSGQSNMEYPVDRSLKKYAGPVNGEDVASAALKNPSDPNVRLFLVDKKQNVSDVVSRNQWQASNDSSLKPVTAAGYFFIKEIQKALDVPVGIISTSWGGSRIEPWTPEESYKKSTLFKPDSTTDFQIDGSKVGNMWNSMVAPIVPFAIKGFLWYQGESNCMINDGMKYADKFELMVNSWRAAWNNNKLPFYFVQISPYYYTKRKDKKPHTPETLAEFWEAQTQTLNIPCTGMIVTTDLVDDLSNIHPSYKWEVGRRLSLLALYNDYGKKNLVISGPVYKSMKKEGNKIILTFDNTGSGLKSRDGQPLKWFTIAGDDNTFVPANAEIVGNTVIVSADGVANPTNVRFAWDETAMPNLMNAEGLPAIPFRTNGLLWKK
jgi:sialate O-acetylesterase